MSGSAIDRIRGLNPSGTALLHSVRDRWRTVAFETGPADHAGAELAVRELYEVAGLPAPRTVLWLASPLEGAIAAYLAAQGSPSVVARVRRLLSLPVQVQLERSFDATVIGEIRTALGEPFWKAVRQLLRDEIGRRVHAATGDRVFGELLRVEGSPRSGAPGAPPWEMVWPHVVSQTHRCGYGQQEASALGFLDLVRRLRLPGVDLAGLGALEVISHSCGWWWPFRDLCIFTERTASLLRDDAGRLHSEHTPALEYQDRFGIYAVGGIGVSQGTIRERNQTQVVGILTERNAEVRRMMLERFGMSRLVRMGFARVLDHDRGRALYQISLPDRSPLVVVQVTCPSTGREYILGVPAGIWRCHDAVAWTFGLQPHEYAPVQET